MSDIVERLREHWHGTHDQEESPCEICQAAADEITRLREELQTSRQVVRTICEEWDEECDCDKRGVDRYVGHDKNCKGTNIAAAKKAMRDELERERVRLAACGVAAMQNTRESIVDRMKGHEWAWSDSYRAVCEAVDREIEHRDRIAHLERVVAAADAMRDGAVGMIPRKALLNLIIQYDAVRKGEG